MITQETLHIVKRMLQKRGGNQSFGRGRRKPGITQAEAAQQIGIGYTTYCQVERGGGMGPQVKALILLWLADGKS
jgi:DNA-binding XRE family transcriptional regulator